MTPVLTDSNFSQGRATIEVLDNDMCFVFECDATSGEARLSDIARATYPGGYDSEGRENIEWVYLPAKAVEIIDQQAAWVQAMRDAAWGCYGRVREAHYARLHELAQEEAADMRWLEAEHAHQSDLLTSNIYI